MSSSLSSPRLVIVGGNAGGASAANHARRMNETARISIFDREDVVSFANCGMPYVLGGEIASRETVLLTKPELFKNRFDVDVFLGQEVTAIHRDRKTVSVLNRRSQETREEPYDKLLLALGSSPIVPEGVPGVTANGVFTLRTIADMDRIAASLPLARTAVIVGGSFIGLELAEQLHRRGLAVTVIEAQPQVLPPLDPEIAESVVRELLACGITVITGTRMNSIADADNQVTGVNLSDGSCLPADVVILGLGVRPNVGLAKAAGLTIGASGAIAVDEYMRTSDPDIYAAGDVAESIFGPTGAPMRAPMAGIANKTGRLAGEHAVTGTSPRAPKSWGTGILRVGKLAVGMTGLSEKAARKAGRTCHAVHVIANHHAGYFPGAKPILLKLIYERPTGLILGAQATGEEGVDKRIDVIATMLALSGTVQQLSELDLVFSPPYGSAKDPLHFVAYTAMNDLAGHTPIVAPDTDLSSYQVVDVRSQAERVSLPLVNADHAIHIPLDDLRGNLGILDPTKPTVVSCKSGQRSHVATRLLKQSGFQQVFNLSGAATVRDLALRHHRQVPAKTSSAESLPSTKA